ncbi:hypothetical protein ACLOJK_030082 [Asimina triloba]
MIFSFLPTASFSVSFSDILPVVFLPMEDFISPVFLCRKEEAKETKLIIVMNACKQIHTVEVTAQHAHIIAASAGLLGDSFVNEGGFHIKGSLHPISVFGDSIKLDLQAFFRGSTGFESVQPHPLLFRARENRWLKRRYWDDIILVEKGPALGLDDLLARVLPANQRSGSKSRGPLSYAENISSPNSPFLDRWKKQSRLLRAITVSASASGHSRSWIFVNGGVHLEFYATIKLSFSW